MFGCMGKVVCVHVASSPSGDMLNNECDDSDNRNGKNVTNKGKLDSLSSDIHIVTPDNRRLDSSIASRSHVPKLGINGISDNRMDASLTPSADGGHSELPYMRDILVRQLGIMEKEDARADACIRDDVISEEWKNLGFIADRFFLGVALLLCLLTSTAFILVLYLHEY